MLHVDDENEPLIRLAYGRGVDGEILWEWYGGSRRGGLV